MALEAGIAYGGVYSLDGFYIAEKHVSDNYFRGLIGNRYFWWIARKLGLVYSESPGSYNPEAETVRHLFYQGYWQSYRYFHDYKSIIKSKLRLVDDSNPKILSYKKYDLERKNPVAIGMRFYEAFPEDAEKHGVSTVDYYLKAMDFLASKESDITFFVFSINIERARKELKDYRGRTPYSSTLKKHG